MTALSFWMSSLKLRANQLSKNKPFCRFPNITGSEILNLMIHLQREQCDGGRMMRSGDSWGSIIFFSDSLTIYTACAVSLLLLLKTLHSHQFILVQVSNSGVTQCINIPTPRMWSIPAAIKAGWEAAVMRMSDEREVGECRYATEVIKQLSSHITDRRLNSAPKDQTANTHSSLVSPPNYCTHNNTQALHFSLFTDPTTIQHLTPIPTPRGSPGN